MQCIYIDNGKLPAICITIHSYVEHFIIFNLLLVNYIFSFVGTQFSQTPKCVFFLSGASNGTMGQSQAFASAAAKKRTV